jgi:hypothetical protein
MMGAMSWRERDWAKWTKEERRHFYGLQASGGFGTDTGSTSEPVFGRTPVSRRRSRSGNGTAWFGLLATVAVALFLAHDLGFSLPGGGNSTVSPLTVGGLPLAPNPVPTAARSSPAPAPRYIRMRGPSSVASGAYMTTTGTLEPGVSGPVLVEGRWSAGPWYRLASTTAAGGTYRVRYLLSRRGVVHVRIALPDGNYAVTIIRVT